MATKLEARLKACNKVLSATQILCSGLASDGLPPVHCDFCITQHNCEKLQYGTLCDNSSYVLQEVLWCLCLFVCGYLYVDGFR